MDNYIHADMHCCMYTDRGHLTFFLHTECLVALEMERQTGSKTAHMLEHLREYSNPCVLRSTLSSLFESFEESVAAI